MKKEQKIKEIIAKLAVDIAAVKAIKEQAIADYYLEVADLQKKAFEAKEACADDPEPENEQTQPQTQPQQTVYCDGSEHTARIVARRLINKMPHVPKGGNFSVTIFSGLGEKDNDYWFCAAAQDGKGGSVTDTFSIRTSDPGKHEAEFIEKVKELLKGKEAENE